jgi:hypothetical protein
MDLAGRLLPKRLRHYGNIPEDYYLFQAPSTVQTHFKFLIFFSIDLNRSGKSNYSIMSFVRSKRVIERLTNQTRTSWVGQVHYSRPFSVTARSSANASSQGYGDGKGDPKAGKPQEQGSQSEAHYKAEHQGPAPPSEGQNTGGATKASSGTKDPSEASANSGGARSKEAKETGSGPTGVVRGSDSESTSTESKHGHKPRISDRRTPDEAMGDAEKQAEVRQHNREFEQRYDRAPKAQEDKVDHKFWSGKS